MHLLSVWPKDQLTVNYQIQARIQAAFFPPTLGLKLKIHIF